jgi:mRNA-degrading endonuclease RelE of RelBE toxin-antitoxin system
VARIVLVRAARLALLDLDWPLMDAVDDAIALLGREPDSGYGLRGRLRGVRALRVGSYRILYELKDDGRTVRVDAILHRFYELKDDGRTVRVDAILHRSVAYRGDPR